ncbi:MAG: diguanylate cyclase [Proteobacteria bacterium]|nr:diguanylate cyclase [Pseudomonadota bacterium]
MKIIIFAPSGSHKDIHQLLQAMEHDIIFSDNEDEVVDIFNKHQPDLVMIDSNDLQLGCNITRQLCEAFEDKTRVPIILMGENFNEGNVEKAINAGIDDILIKPVSKTILIAKINSLKRFAQMRTNLLGFDMQLKEANEKLLTANQLLSELSLKDPLTRLGNRRLFEETLTKYCRTAIRENEPISLLMIDLDNFKAFNDTYGHQAGDYCLQRLAQVLKHGIHRPLDFAARFSTEQFAVLLPNTPFAGGIHVGERLRLAVEMLQMQHKRSPLGTMTVSIGVACSKINVEFASSALVAIAESALMEAKGSGKNCVIGAKDLVDDKVSDNFIKLKKHPRRINIETKGHH